MEEKFYFTLYCGSFVANTYIGSRSNAKAYFKRWVRKTFPIIRIMILPSIVIRLCMICLTLKTILVATSWL